MPELKQMHMTSGGTLCGYDAALFESYCAATEDLTIRINTRRGISII